MANFDMNEYLKNKKLTNAVLAGQTANTSNTGNKATTPTVTSPLSIVNTATGANKKATTGTGALTKVNTSDVQNYYNNLKENVANNTKNGYYYGGSNGVGLAAALPSGSGGSSGSSGTSGNSALLSDYQSTLNDLYNNVMGYGSYTPSTYTPTTFTANTYTPSVYSRTVDTSETEAALKAALADIQGYGDFSYDLNADMLYQNALDNYMMLGNQAMVDATANAAALTGGYGNSYAASVGNQAYQNYITQANNMIPEFQQMALNTWQSGLDRRMGVYDAVSQQLANLLNLENTNFNIWNANESNAANAFSMNESNRYNAWASNEQNAYNAWAQNEENAYNEWLTGYTQAQDQYELAKDYYETLQSMQKSSSTTTTSTSSKTPSQSAIDAVKQGIANAFAGVTSPYNNSQYYDWLEQLQKKN